MSANLDLLEAVKAGDVERVKALLEPDPALVNARDDSGNSAVLLAVYYGRKNVVELLLSYKPHMNLFEASAAGDLQRVTALLREFHRAGHTLLVATHDPTIGDLSDHGVGNLILEGGLLKLSPPEEPLADIELGRIFSKTNRQGERQT